MSLRLVRVVASLAATGALAGGGYTLKHLPRPAPSAQPVAQRQSTTSSSTQIDAAAQSVIAEATLLEHRIQLARDQLQHQLLLSAERDAATTASMAKLANEKALLDLQRQQLVAEAGRLASEQAELTAERSRSKASKETKTAGDTSAGDGTTTSTTTSTSMSVTTSTAAPIPAPTTASTTTSTTIAIVSTTTTIPTSTTTPGSTTTTTIRHREDD
jgi:hypothetical protein